LSVVEHFSKAEHFNDKVIVRVYSQLVEHEKYPVPRELIIVKKRVSDADRERMQRLRRITLHEMIRQGDGKLAKSIRKFDELNPKVKPISDDDIKKYLKNISEAQREILNRADVILCTCTTSSAERVARIKSGSDSIATSSFAQVCYLFCRKCILIIKT
jgi:predicted nuclease with TOPRIM domain